MARSDGQRSGDEAQIYTFAVIACFGVVLTAGYMLWTIQRVYFGPEKAEYKSFPEVDAREITVLTPLTIMAILLGELPGMMFFVMTDNTDSAVITVLAMKEPMLGNLLAIGTPFTPSSCRNSNNWRRTLADRGHRHGAACAADAPLRPTWPARDPRAFCAMGMALLAVLTGGEVVDTFRGMLLVDHVSLLEGDPPALCHRHRADVAQLLGHTMHEGDAGVFHAALDRDAGHAMVLHREPADAGDRRGDRQPAQLCAGRLPQDASPGCWKRR